LPGPVVNLSRQWSLGEQLGGGGFGRVFSAASPEGQPAAVKLIPKRPGADRELLIADLQGIRNVVPVLDSGDFEDYWVLVMPLAGQSLRDYLNSRQALLELHETIAVLQDIAECLVDLDGRIVHRDLKPENVLLLNGRWCLADFGIARYADATTAANTWKMSLTREYAAPERWRAERATSATDIYAVGVIAYEMLSGRRPFPGPGEVEFRDQHLRDVPPPLTAVPASLGSLVSECLLKAPEARPTPANLLARFERLASAPVSAGRARLQRANREAVVKLAEQDRLLSEARSREEREEELYRAAVQLFGAISTTLHETVRDDAPAARLIRDRESWTLTLGQGELRWLQPVRFQDAWGGPPPAMSVLAYTHVQVSTVPRSYTRAHSLWFCDAQERGSFRWYETAFMVTPLLAGRRDWERTDAPFALPPGHQAAQALLPMIGEFQVAYPFTPLATGELDEFVDRWATWLADAAEGRLQRPWSLPEKSPQGSWRT
jgi:hypothetical protein